MQLLRYLFVGAGTVGLYVGGVAVGTQLLGLPPRPVNFVFYVLCTAISFALAYGYVFGSDAGKGGALVRYLLLSGLGILFNALWLEAGLRLTPLWPWVIAASFFAVWPFLSFAIQKRYVFTRGAS